MANDADWVADVRRWYFSSQQAVTVPADGDSVEIGYEAADPALQSRHWPDAPRPGFIDLK